MRNSQNNKGFSLVELIIVMAIIVALVAVIAPQYIKYINKTHDAVLETAAEDVLGALRTEYGVGNMNGVGTVTVKRGDDGKLSVTLSDGIVYESQNGESFADICGIDTSKTIQSDKIFTITVSSTTGGYLISKPEDAVFETSVYDPENP